MSSLARLRVVAVAVSLILLLCPLATAVEPPDADALWARRGDVIEDRLADPGRIEAAIALYRERVVREPRSLEASWKLLRALHYLIDFSSADEARKDQAVDEAVALAGRAAEQVENEDASPGDRAALSFWTAIVWGVRGQRVGLLTIVREGVASRMRDHAERSIELDPNVDAGGALRLMSRLHAELPRVPFVSGWVDRDQILPLARRALSIDPDHPGNQLVLALALLERSPGELDESLRRLQRVSSLTPRQASRAEDLAIREQARLRLAELAPGPR